MVSGTSVPNLLHVIQVEGDRDVCMDADCDCMAEEPSSSVLHLEEWPKPLAR